jgi:cyclopropane fatty-acyl-phospholipid synthase-like methyltransferase
MKIGNYELQVPFVTTSSDNLKTVIELSEIKPAMKVVDLGSGDGRVVLEFAKHKATVHGFEIRPELVERSIKRISDAGLEEKITIFQSSFWDVDLSAYDIIYIYGMQSVLVRLEQKLEQEMNPGASFISNIFRLPKWRAKKIKDGVHLYVR